MPHALITGGASGLGLGCARRFAQLGFSVTLADIDSDAASRALPAVQADAVHDAACTYEHVDLSDANSIRQLADRMFIRGESIDVLVNNAGIYPPSQRTLTPEGHELTFAIAHLGHFRLTHDLWPLLNPESARVISVSSLVQRRAHMDLDDLTLARNYMPVKAYQQAKLSCLLFALELQRKLDAAASPIRSHAAHPGVCRTQLARNRRRSAQDRWWQRFSSNALDYLLSHVGQSPENGAAAVIEAALSPTIPAASFIGPTGPFEAFGKPGIIKPGTAAADPKLAAELWQRSEQLTGVRWSL